MDLRRKFYIQFEGLKEGVHHFDFEVDDAFFTAFEGSLVDRADIHVSLELEKKSTLMVLDFSISGVVIWQCDRCGDPLDIPMDLQQQLIVKYGSEDEESSEEIAFVPHSAYEMDLAPYIYEYIVLALPLRNVHPPGSCNPETVALLDKLNTREDEEIDPRWSKLKDLKTDN